MDAGEGYRLFRLGSSNSELLPEELVASHELGGGLSGAQVFLVFPKGDAPLILKCDVEAVAIVEDETRRQREYNLAPLALRGADHVALTRDGEEGLSLGIIAYSYFGPLRYEEIGRYSNFEALVQDFVTSGRFSDEQIGFVLESLAEKVIGAPPPKQATATPLDSTLSTPKWDELEQLLAALEQSSAVDVGLTSLRQWWDQQIDAIGITPFPDQRTLHGDPRFANILVNRANSQVEVIDYGAGRTGHVFRDLARFELDLWLRSTSWSEPEIRRSADVRARVLAALGYDHPDMRPNIKIAVSWRNLLHDQLPALRNDAVKRMYHLYIVAEILRRLTWIGPSSQKDVGGSARDLIFLIRTLRDHFDGIDPASRSEDLSVVLREQLGVTRIYVSTYASGQATGNWENLVRNEEKKKAILRAAERGEVVCLLAETGNSYLHVRGRFFDELVHLLSRGGTLRVLLMDPGARLVAGMNLEKFRESVSGAEVLASEHPGRVEVRVLKTALTSTMLLTPNTVFYEPYFHTDRDRRERLLFDTFEFVFDPMATGFGKTLAEHFDQQFALGSALGDQVIG